MLYWVTHGGEIRTKPEIAFVVVASLTVGLFIGLALKAQASTDDRVSWRSIPLVLLAAAVVLNVVGIHLPKAKDWLVPAMELLILGSGVASTAFLIADRRRGSVQVRGDGG